MNRPALARLYRPRKFSEIVGQDHVSTTLRTAVERGRVAHAYLFCGPRGVGKTTAARVLAMALNCENREGGEPCGTCASCESIWLGRTSLDVVEIDAASNRGVDDARDLRERAMYAPSEESRFKVYIIDEAHMLTREAWNAFLKIFEEPPPRVIFVLATTEPGKILQSAPPILSRCQRFDFHRISAERIGERLREVLGSEGVEAEEAALIPIIRKADGALRDALSGLDQVLAFSGERVTANDVRQVLGLVDEEIYFELFEIIGDRRAADVFGFVERLIDGGYDLEEFYKGLGEALRLLLRRRLEGTARTQGGQGAGAQLSQKYLELGQKFATGDLLRMLSALAELDTDGRFRKSEQQRILIEILLLKFAILDRTVELAELIAAARGGGGGGGNPLAGSELGGGGKNEPAGGRAPTVESKVSAPRSEVGPGDPPAGGSGTRGKMGANSPLGAAREAWQGMIADGQVLRPVQGIVLRAARVLELRGKGELVVSTAAGTPGAEALADTVTRRRIEEELSRRLGSPIRLKSIADQSAPLAAVDEGLVRKQRLDELIQGDQSLQRLVEPLDLALID